MTVLATGPGKPFTCFLVAAEHSGDHLGATLMRALRRRYGEAVRFDGVGGAEMAAEGLSSLFPIEELAIIGFTSIPTRFPMFVRHLFETSGAALAARPDVLVIIDSPDFTHRVARRVRAKNAAIPIVDYVCPSVWAWRPWRARAMRRYVDHVLAILPFEPEALARLGGPPCTYVGHPLLERVDKLRPDAQERRRRESGPPLILVLPGSRAGELRRLLPVFEQAIARVAARVGAMELVLPTKPHLAAAVEAAVARWAIRPRIVTGLAEQ
jgi:lipid-A-disaccharide synthase